MNGKRHVFKVVSNVPGTSQRQTLKLDTRNVDEAVKQAIDFDKRVKSEGAATSKEREGKTALVQSQAAQPTLLTHALARFVGWLHNENVPKHLRVERSPEHLKDIERELRVLVEGLRNNKYDMNQVTVSDIDDEMVGHVYEYLLDTKKFSNRTFNKYLGTYTSFLKWYSEEYEIPIKNRFEKVIRRKTHSNPEAITEEEFSDLLTITTQENGYQEYESGIKKRRNVYYSWLRDGFRLALQTGRRREELAELNFKDIITDEDGKPTLIKIEDIKVNRIQHRDESNKKYIFIPVTEGLRELLHELGYEEQFSEDRYILAPEVVKNRAQVICNGLSRGFAHFYKQLNTGRDLSFKSIRKAYISSMYVLLGVDAKAVTGHSGQQVLEQHYLDQQVIEKAKQRFEVFPKETTREKEVQSLRDNTKTQSKNQEVTK